MTSRLKPGSQNARIVAALDGNGLADNRPNPPHRGFQPAQFRGIAELREYGYVIPSRHVEGKVGPYGTEYMLVAVPRDASPQNGSERVVLDTVGAAEVAGPVSLASQGTAIDEPIPGQLTLDEVAA